MAASLVQSVQMLNSTASATTYNSATTITTSGGLAIAYISGESDTAGATPSISSLTLGGVAMTVQGAIPTTAGGRAWSAIAILNNASVTAGAVAITTTATQRAMAIRVAEWTGHDTTTPIDQNFGNGGGSGSTSLTASAALTNAGGVYTGVVTVDSGTANTSIVANATETIFATSGQTGTTAFSDNSWQSGYEAHATTGTYSFGFNWTGGNYSTLKVVEIKEAAGGGSVASASGTGAASGVGQSVMAGVGSSSGVGTAQGTGQSVIAAVGSAAGTGSAQAVAGGAGSVAAASGTGTATGIGQSIIAAVGAASGTGTASGAGQKVVAAVGAASGIGTAQALSPVGSVAAAVGAGTAAGVARIIIAAIGQAQGQGSAIAISPALISAIYASPGDGPTGLTLAPSQTSLTIG